MKKFSSYLFALFLMGVLYTPVTGQIIARCTPLWVSSKGYWIIETNIHSRSNSTIRYYNNDHVLVHIEYVTNKKMNLKDREVKIQLKEALEIALIRWEFTHQSAYNKETLTSSLH